VEKSLGAVTGALSQADQEKLKIAVLRHVAREQEFQRQKVDHIPVPLNGQEFPRMIHYWDRRSEKVEDLESYLSWPAGWGSRHEFERFLPPVRKLDEEGMLQCVEAWDLEGLTPQIRSRLQGALLQAHSKIDGVYERDQIRAMHDATCQVMKAAFDDFANVLFDERILTAQVVTGALPDLIWLAAIAGGWWHTSDLVDHYIFNAKIGPYHYFRHDEQDWTQLFRAQQLHWRGELLRRPTQQASELAQRRDLKLDQKAPRSSTKKSGPYAEIDAALRQIAEARPSNQQEVFKQLDWRNVRIPPAEPFRTAKSWIAGFKKNESDARSWLSKRWANLELSAFPKGPK
jgi:hypothetical protein